MKRYVFGILSALLAFALVLACASGASAAMKGRATRVVSHDSAAVNGVVVPRSASPYEIARVVNANRRKWDRRRVSERVDLAGTWATLGVEPNFFDECSSNCEAKILMQELDGERGGELLLKLTKSLDFARYLVFKSAPAARGARWKLLGYVDHDFNRYGMSRHRVERALGRPWLVVWGQEGSGTGYSLFSETWYEVGAGGLRPVLKYPAEGNVYPWPEGVGRKFKARFAGARGRSVALTYTVRYERLDYMRDEFEALYRNRHRAVYAWDASRREFAFDAARSDVSEAEIYAVADLEEAPGEGEQVGGSKFFSEGDAWKRGGYDVFLKYNLRSLLRAARGRDEGRKEWLRKLLPDFADTPEKRLLEGALNAGGGARR